VSDVKYSEVAGLRVSVDDVIYMPSLDAPDERPHPFAYFITVHNDTTSSVTIRARKWVLAQESGDRIVVEGEGVVGQFPRISPAGTFSYNSYHVVGANTVAQGAFFIETSDGVLGYTPIPEFDLAVPKWV